MTTTQDGDNKRAKRKLLEDKDCGTSKQKHKGKLLRDDLQVCSESDSSVDDIEDEQEKLKGILSNLGNKSIASLPKRMKEGVASCDCKEELQKLRDEMEELHARMIKIEHSNKKVHIDKAYNVTPEGKHTSSACSSPDSEIKAPVATGEKIEHNGLNLLTVKAPSKEPHKNALRLLDKLFTSEELSRGILFSSKRSSKEPLDQERVDKLFEVLYANYGKERVQKMHQQIVDVCNQKCRDCARRLSATQLKRQDNLE